LIAILLNSGALGVLTVQVYFYYLAFTKDSFYNKAVVYGIFILETVQTIMGFKYLFLSLVYGYMDAQSVDRVRDLWFTFPVLG
ncbi:hypothetical protein CVT25_013618, partial [Psilocybe cyanescens]